MRGIVIEQLTIFRTWNTFDATKAIRRKLPRSKMEYCEVLGYVPQDALSPLENGHNSKGRSKTKDFQYEQWENHCCAIWLFRGCSWDEAISLLQQHRDNKTPVGMKFYKSNIQAYESTQIEKYLEPR
ncbi:hypothetical protein [Alkalihalobacillus sp. LMS39]|uniref:hypothetical protein n=1 Tax=Alkalihalobacillus sp. LMS39 TaxID=2924032 RepID=UPI001FB43805|nr:hypothetical protein [Alkalihalobacillus sp. LMS39]UOE96057.1 hypothetical protein MM271_10850 [Alkalihalobacillus sp. LMS39]